MGEHTSTSGGIPPDIVQCPHCHGWFPGWQRTDGPHPVAHDCPYAGVRIYYEYRRYPYPIAEEAEND